MKKLIEKAGELSLISILGLLLMTGLGTAATVSYLAQTSGEVTVHSPVDIEQDFDNNVDVTAGGEPEVVEAEVHINADINADETVSISSTEDVDVTKETFDSLTYEVKESEQTDGEWTEHSTLQDFDEVSDDGNQYLELTITDLDNSFVEDAEWEKRLEMDVASDAKETTYDIELDIEPK